MSKYIGFPEYNGTRERTVALVLDNHLIFGKDGRASLLMGTEGLVDAILTALDERDAELKTQKEKNHIK